MNSLVACVCYHFEGDLCGKSVQLMAKKSTYKRVFPLHELEIKWDLNEITCQMWQGERSVALEHNYDSWIS